MITAALSLAVACAELGDETRESVWVVYDRDGPLSVLPLALGAMEVAVVWACLLADQCGWRPTRCPGGWAVQVAQRSSARAARAGAYHQQ